MSAVRGPFADRSSDLSVTFRTDEAPLYLLGRSPALPGEATKAPDRIVRTTVGSAETSVVFSAPYIQSFVPVGDELVVATLNDDLTNVLSLVDPDGRAAGLTLPGTGTVHDLQASPSSSTVGFRFSSSPGAAGNAYDNTLFLLDLTRGTVDTVAGLDGQPVQAIAWGFMADRAEIVAQLFDTTLLLIDPRSGSEAAPIPIGQFPNLNAFAPDGLRIAVSDQGSQYILDLSTGTEAAIVPQDVAGSTPYTAELHFLTGRGVRAVGGRIRPGHRSCRAVAHPGGRGRGHADQPGGLRAGSAQQDDRGIHGVTERPVPRDPNRAEQSDPAERRLSGRPSGHHGNNGVRGAVHRCHQPKYRGHRRHLVTPGGQ